VHRAINASAAGVGRACEVCRMRRLAWEPGWMHRSAVTSRCATAAATPSATRAASLKGRAQSREQDTGSWCGWSMWNMQDATARSGTRSVALDCCYSPTVTCAAAGCIINSCNTHARDGLVQSRECCPSSWGGHDVCTVRRLLLFAWLQVMRLMADATATTPSKRKLSASVSVSVSVTCELV